MVEDNPVTGPTSTEVTEPKAGTLHPHSESREGELGQ